MCLGCVILGKSKDNLLYNFNSSYLRDQSHKRFKPSFGSIRARMAELELLLYTGNYIYQAKFFLKETFLPGLLRVYIYDTRVGGNFFWIYFLPCSIFCDLDPCP